jgi:hypothetical protein
VISMEVLDDSTYLGWRDVLVRFFDIVQPSFQLIEMGALIGMGRLTLAVANDRGYSGCRQRTNGNAGQHSRGRLRHSRSYLGEHSVDNLGCQPALATQHNGLSAVTGGIRSQSTTRRQLRPDLTVGVHRTALRRFRQSQPMPSPSRSRS